MVVFQAFDGAADARLVADEWRAEGHTADETDDVGGDLLVGHLGDGGVEFRFSETFAVQQRFEMPETLAGEIFRPGANDVEGHDLVAIVLDEAGKFLEIIFGACAGAVATAVLDDFVGAAVHDDGRLRRSGFFL